MASKKKKPTTRKKKKSKKGHSGGKSGTPISEALQERAAAARSLEEVAGAAATETEPPSEVPAAPSIRAEPPPEAPRVEELAPVALDDEDIPVIDLDADELDDPIERLIAETVARATPRVVVEPPEAPVDLDAELAHRAQPEPTRDEPAHGAAAAETLPPEEDAAQIARPLVDLGPVSSPEMRTRLLAEALAHAEHKDARYRIPFSRAAAVGRWKALAGTVILLLAGMVALVPPDWTRPEPPAELTAEERLRNVRAALLLQAQQVEAFRVRTQRLPSTLDEVGARLPGVRYVRSGTRAYQLVAFDPSGSAVVYDSTNPGPAFADLTIRWPPSSGAP